MPLQQLVEYFNDRLEQQHNTGYRPFIIENDKVAALFGPMRIGSELIPVRELNHQAQTLGYAAQIRLSTCPALTLQNSELDHLIASQTPHANNTDSIISFDRLTRTVHMLNYLPESHLNGLLFLDVDPRHILGVKTDHGAYFEEIIGRCGLETSNIAISLNINGLYSRFYQSLLKGLSNYQRRGYKIAIKFDYSGLDKSAFELIERSGADFVGLSTQGLEQLRRDTLNDKLLQLIAASHAINSRCYVFNTDSSSAVLWQHAGFDLIQAEAQHSTWHYSDCAA